MARVRTGYSRRWMAQSTPRNCRSVTNSLSAGLKVLLGAMAFGTLLVSLALAREPGFGEYRAVQESLRGVPPKMRMEWLHGRGIQERTEDRPTIADSGLRLVSKWGRGPAAEVTGKDTLVVLTLGSEVALLSLAEPDSPRVLSEIQLPSLTAQSYLEDSLLYSSSSADIEVWNIADPTQPVKRGQLLGAVGDFWIRDTFLYFIRSDTFHVVSIANSANLRELGSCIDSGSVTTGSGNTVVVTQNGGYAFVDVSNPASPHQVGAYPCGRTFSFSAAARGNLVCASYEEAGYPYPTRFITLDISTPSSPRLLAKLNDLGGYDIFLDGPLAFVSGGDPSTEQPLALQILSIADSAHPAFIDSCRATHTYPWGIWENSSLDRALVADEYNGLAIVDISNLNNPILKAWVLRNGLAWDVHVDGQRCYVASDVAGMRLLDVSDPTRPTCISGTDSAFVEEVCRTVTARDSFAYMTWWPGGPFRTVSMSDPLHPQAVATCSLFNWAEDMVLRDSFIYCAENNKFQIVNVARPRAPVVVGTFSLPERAREVILADTLAYVATLGGAVVASVAQPQNPHVLGTWPRDAMGIDLRDTVLYVVTYTNDSEDVFLSLSVANPAAPYVLDSAIVPRTMEDVVVVDSIAYCAGSEMAFVSVADPHNLRRLAYRWVPPSWIRRVICAPPYLYTCCTDGGVCIQETLATGIAEQPSHPIAGRVRAVPTVTTGRIRLLTSDAEPWWGQVIVYDAMGAEVAEMAPSAGLSGSKGVDLSNAPGGVYLLRIEMDKGSSFVKVVKTKGR